MDVTPGCYFTIVLDLDRDQALYDALRDMAEEDERTITQQVRWILKEYVKDHCRYIARELERNFPVRPEFMEEEFLGDKRREAEKAQIGKPPLKVV